MEQTYQKEINYVALYLRKSRGDIDSDLEKHKKILIDLCLEKRWKYVEFCEIGSGDSIHARPVFQRLLYDVKNEVFDAVCVVDFDRLGRGDEGDQATIKKAFSKTDTWVVTPSQTYNLNNENDEFSVDFHGFIARQEYKKITKRLSQGKKVGARMGMWTNGRPPYPYEYQRWGDKFNNKGLVVNDDKLKTYRYIIESVIKDGKTPSEIAWELNRQGIPSPRYGDWGNVTIGRLIVDETHLGRIITNKTVGDGHAKRNPDAKEFKRLSKDQWVVVENCHEAVKTIEEHEKLLLFASRLTKVPKRKPAQVRPLSGLVKCGICGHTMTFYYRPERKNPESLKPCWFRNPIGEKCPNNGMLTGIIYDTVNREIMQYKEELATKIKSLNVDAKKNDIDSKLEQLEIQRSHKERALSRILDAFEGGAYTLNQFKIRKEKAESEIAAINDQIEILKIEQRHYSVDSIKNCYELIEDFESEMNGGGLLSDKQKNDLYKSIIDCIIWTRKDNIINIEVKFK